MTTRTDAPSDALAEPTTPVTAGWVARMTIASIGLWAGFFGPIQVLLAQQAAAFAPENKETVLAVVTGIGALVSTLGNPLWGALSDRTSGPRGRRMPWIAGGALVGAIAMVVLAVADSVAVMIVGWCLAQAGLNAMLAAITASVPDLVPVGQRGAVSGWVGVAQTLGIVVGTGVATGVGGIRAGYLTLAALVVVTALAFVVRTGDVPLARRRLAPVGLVATVRGFWISPRRHPDFAWAWATRFLVNVSNSLGTLYLLFYLTDAVRVPDPEGSVFVLVLVYAAALMVTAVAAGIWSDRTGRRKPFVVASGVIMAVAALILALVPTWPGALAGAVVLGLGFGVYSAVDFALITQVLPSAGDRAKDLGVVNIANALPQVLAPAIAAPVLALFATAEAGYRWLYVLAAVVGLVGAVLVVRIRSVD